MNPNSSLKSIATLLVAALVGMIHGQVTTGFDFLIDASNDPDTDDRAEDLVAGNPSGLELLLDDSPLVQKVAVGPTVTQFTHAYEFPGGSTGNEAGALLVDTGTTTTRSFQNAPGDWSNNAMTMEIWFKPDNLTPSPSNGQIIFEDGGGTGLGFFIDNNELVCGQDSNSPLISYNLNTDPSSLLLGSATSEFIQVVVARTGGGATEMYVNGVSVGTANDDNDWSGGDAAAFGTRGGANVGGRGSGQSSTESFDGQLALIRVYDGQVLTAGEILANFNDNSGPDNIEPIIETTNPADEDTGVYPGADLVATFSEEIALTGSGTVTITDLNDASGNLTINLPDAQVTASGTDVIISLSGNLEFGTEYEVNIDGAAVEDTADTPNAFAGTSVGDWNFTTAAEDLTPPVLSTTNPADDATEVVPDAVLTATFDENIVTGTGNITIQDLTNTTTFATIAVTDTSQVSVSGNTLTIDPTTPFGGAVEYAVQFDAGVVKNFSDVGNLVLNDTTTWSFTTASTTTYTGPNDNDSDVWNDAGNWDIAIPTGALDVVIPAGKYATAWNDATPTYTGDLSIGDGATIGIGWTNNLPDSFNALGTAGSTIITMGADSLIKSRTSASPDIPAIVLTGDAGFSCGESTQTPASPNFGQPITGAHQFTVTSNASGPTVIFGATNTFDGLVVQAISGRGGNHGTVKATAAGGFGAGDVSTVPVGDQALKLEFDVTGAMDSGATLNVNGKGPSGDGSNRVQMDADNTIGFLNVQGFAYPAGTYGRVGTPASVDYEVDWMAGDSVLTVTSAPADSTPPVVVITDDSVSGEVFLSLQPTITYTLTFDESITTSVTTADFGNAGSAPVTIDSVTQTDLNVVEVVVTATDTGSISLVSTVSASFDDLFGNTLSGPLSDENTVLVRDIGQLSSELGILDLTANNGVNPATGLLWQDGDNYRLAFVSSTTSLGDSTDIATYNAFVQGVAGASTTYANLGTVTWYAIASTATIDARDNTSTNPNTDGAGESVYNMNQQLFASDYAELWDGDAFGTYRIQYDENGVQRATDNPDAPGLYTSHGAVYTGTSSNGTKNSDPLGGDGSGNVLFGLHSAEDHFWVQRGSTNLSSNFKLPLYALSEQLTVTSSVPGSIYDTWAGGTFANPPFTDTDPNDNPDGDNLVNLLEFAFGTDPTVSNNSSLAWDGSTLTPGTPIVEHGFSGSGVDFTATFIRRADHGTSGSADYAWRFSSDLTDWESSADTPGWYVAPTVTTVGDYQVVEVPYPFFLDNNKKARFFQVEVTPVE